MSTTVPVNIYRSKETEEPEEFVYSPLSLDDIEDLDSWVRKRHIDLAKPHGADVVAIALQQATTMTFMSGVGAKLLATVEGMAYLCWLSLSKKHPEVSITESRKWMQDSRNISNVREAFTEAAKRNPTPGTQRTKGPNKERKQKNHGKRGKKRKSKR